MTKACSLTVIIPAYDENKNLEVLIPQVSTQLKNLGIQNSQILVVMRAHEADDSLRQIQSLGAVAIRRIGDDNFGSAIKTGIAYSEIITTHTLFMDADGSHSPNSIPKLWNTAITTSVDIVIASRYVKGGSTANSFLEIQMSRILNAIYALVLGIDVKDISTNFKIYKSSLLSELELNCSNYDIVEEILLKIKRKKKNLVIKEIPDHFEQRKFGQSKRKLSIFIASYIVTLYKLRFTRENT